MGSQPPQPWEPPGDERASRDQRAEHTRTANTRLQPGPHRTDRQILPAAATDPAPERGRDPPSPSPARPGHAGGHHARGCQTLPCLRRGPRARSPTLPLAGEPPPPR